MADIVDELLNDIGFDGHRLTMGKAACEIERLRAELAARDALLREAREMLKLFEDDVWPGNYRIVCARIDALINGDGNV